MNKAKAIFAACIIVVVAGASSALWYLNDSGKLENENISDTADDSYEAYGEENGDKAEVQKTTEMQTTTQKADENDGNEEAVAEAEINEFLSVFANVYFAEQSGAFKADNCSDYDLILFACLHIRNTDNSAMISQQMGENNDYYFGFPCDRVNEVLDKYIGKTVPLESVYTENAYEFFLYEDGYFYTLAADGMGYINTAKADSVSYNGDEIIVQFTIFAGNEAYADGEAKIKATDDGLKLSYYKVFE